MKKNCLSFLLVFLVLTVVSCQGNTTVPTYDSHLSGTNVPSDLVFAMVDYPNSFSSELTDIQFNVLMQEVCFDYRIVGTFLGYEYYVATTAAGADSGSVSAHLSDSVSQGNVCVDLPEADSGYEIAILRKESGSQVTMTTDAFKSDGFTFAIPSTTARKHVATAFISYVLEGEGQLTTGATIQDLEGAVTAIEFVLTQTSTGTMVETRHVEITADLREDGLIDVRDILFTGLEAGTEYDIFLQLSGNDGVDAFAGLPAHADSGIPD